MGKNKLYELFKKSVWCDECPLRYTKQGDLRKCHNEKDLCIKTLKKYCENKIKMEWVK
jgi:hypothetical protein